MRRRAVTALIGTALCWSSPGEAQVERTSSLGWTRLGSAETCIATHELAEAVEARLHKTVFVSAARADIAVEGHIERAGDAWHAVITITDKNGIVLGTRELSRSTFDCRALDEDLVLAVALMIDPDSLLAPTPPGMAPTPSPVAPNVVVRTIFVPVSPPEPNEPWRTRLLFGPSFSVGLLPSAGAGLSVRGEIAPPHFPAFAIGGTLWFSNDAEVSMTGAQFQLVEGFVSLCPLVTRLRATTLGACAGTRVGSLRVGGFGFALDDTKERVTASGVLEARVTQRIVGPLVISGGPSLIVPFVRDTFVYEDVRAGDLQVFKMSSLAGILEVSLGIEMP